MGRSLIVAALRNAHGSLRHKNVDWKAANVSIRGFGPINEVAS